MLYLRARYYNPLDGRFQSRDTWGGDTRIPMSFNHWLYVGGNPINLTDPSGNFPPIWCQMMPNKSMYEGCVNLWYGIEPINFFTSYGEFITGERGCYHGPSRYRAPGYIEGTGLAIASPSIVNWLFAVESVYDFSTMEHDYFVSGSFDVAGVPGVGFSDFLWGAVYSQYSGYVYGLRSDRFLENQYGGLSIVGYIGASIGSGGDLREGVGAGIGFTGFVSNADPAIRGYTKYVSMSVGFELPIPFVDTGLGIIYMKSGSGSRPSRYVENMEVKALKLYSHILLGKHSIWLSDLYPIPSKMELNSRFAAANMALKYAIVFRELQIEKK